MGDTQIIDQGRERKYFIMIPNMVMKLELSPFAVALYCRLKWRAGEDGVCFENTRNMARGCKMSAGQISKAKRELETAGLIQIATHPGKHGGRDYHVITIVDIWLQNMKRCSPGGSPSSPDELASSQDEPNKNTLNLLATEKTQGKEEERDAAERVSLDTREKSSRAPGDYDSKRIDEFKALRSHPALQAVKHVTGFYPKRSRTLYQRIIDTLGETPDIQKMERCFATWIQRGYNPQNIDWLFEWYPNDMYYVIGAIKAEIMA